MERVRWEHHKGKKILLIDYSGLKAGKSEEKKLLLETVKKAQETAAAATSKILFLTIATDSQADNEIMSALKAFAKFTADHNRVEKECIVGITGIQKALLQGVNFFSGGHLKPFDTIEQAKEWLIS